MPYVVSGSLATLTSLTASTMASQLLITGTRQVTFGVDLTGDQEETTPLDGTTLGATTLAGLRSGVINFDGMFTRAAPLIGNAGLVTLDSSHAGYAVRLHEYEITIDFGEEDITGFNATPPTWKVFRPGGKYNWSGRFSGRLMSDANAGVPPTPNSTGAAATFKIAENGASDSAFSGSIIVPGVQHAINRNNPSQLLNFAFTGSGALTETKGSTYAGLLVAATSAIGRITGAGAEGSTDWDINGDGTPDVSAVLTAFTGITYTCPVFLKTVTFRVGVGTGIRASGQLRIADALVVAP